MQAVESHQMSKRMLIDAAHAEETRVAVVDGTRVEDFDFESRARKQLRGNIYLAKVTRVEPSLQAAFVEYGGNRHGFLAFNEVHPDYYQIPVADREALLREEAEENEHHQSNGRAAHQASSGEDGEDSVGDDEDDVMEEEAERRRRRLLRRYKIQEVIKRRQIMLVQVVKDERGAKGASLTTYLSLAGRYCVLMPNTARGGGVSRKIASATDRKRLKDIIHSLDVPDGMGLIVRTAGAKRTKAEIKRDYEYLMRLWENIREVTLKSIAPALIYEEEDLVKRAIRDMFDKDIDSIEVEGEEGYREARDFMRMIMPSQAKKIQPYRDATPLFVKHRIEDGLAQIYSPVAPLRSGGYLVINQTEALVAVDVNSGKSTRERNIESTALKTNLEAAEEAARQLRLRDLAGLIVIDFIDMEESKNNRLVEKRLKDCLKDDRARIQMGKISAFGLMELSRQRRRTGVLEGTTHVCPHCAGVGRVRSVESSALSALRAIELEAARHGAGALMLRVPAAVGLYILNEKRANLVRLHHHLGLLVSVQLDDSVGHAEHQIERTATLADGEGRPAYDPTVALAQLPPETDDFEYVEEDEEEEDAEENEGGAHAVETVGDDDDSEGASSSEDGGAGRRRRRRRRGRRGDEPGETNVQRQDLDADDGDEPAATAAAPRAQDDEGGDDAAGRSRRRRRRGRRGGQRVREDDRPADAYGWTRARTPDGSDPYGWYDTAQGAAPRPAEPAANDERPPARPAVASAPKSVEVEDVWVELPAEPDAVKPARSRSRRGKAAAPAPVAEPVAVAVEVDAEPAPPPIAADADDAPAAKPARKPRRTKAAAAVEADVEPTVAQVEPEPAPAPAPVLVQAEPEPAPVLVTAEPDPAEVTTPPAAPRRGWWRRGG